MPFNRRNLLLGCCSAAVMPINRPEAVDDRDSSVGGINTRLINGAENNAAGKKVKHTLDVKTLSSRSTKSHDLFHYILI